MLGFPWRLGFWIRGFPCSSQELTKRSGIRGDWWSQASKGLRFTCFWPGLWKQPHRCQTPGHLENWLKGLSYMEWSPMYLSLLQMKITQCSANCSHHVIDQIPRPSASYNKVCALLPTFSYFSISQPLATTFLFSVSMKSTPPAPDSTWKWCLTVFVFLYPT